MKKIILCLFLSWVFLYLNVRETCADNPYIDIKANGSDGPVIINSNESLSISVAVRPYSLNNVNADWWLFVFTPWNNWLYYIYPNYWNFAGANVSDISYAYQGPLFDLPLVEITNFADLPIGIYTFYFGIDISPDGILNDPVYDKVVVNKVVPYRIYGLNVSPYIKDNQNPNRGGDQVTDEELWRVISIVAPYTKWIRTYGCNEDLKEAGKFAHKMGLKAAIGIWLSSDRTENERQISCLIQRYREGDVDLVIVGSEALFRGDLNERELIDYINRVKEVIPDIPIAYADVYDIFLSHPNLTDAVDILMVNYYPFWDGVDIKEAMYFLNLHHQEVVSAAKGKPVIVSETGWPSGGEPFGKAVPSPENAAFYFLNFISWVRANNVDYFYFEAFDEPWKAEFEGTRGAHWGIWDKYGKIKPGMERVFVGRTMEDNWSSEIPCGPEEPFIQFTYVPPKGSFENLKGRVCHVNPEDYKVAVYIYVSGWWTKPYWDQPLTTISPSGEWECDITTGGSDQNASKIAAFLVPADYDPPLMRGEETLPQELKDHAVAEVEITR